MSHLLDNHTPFIAACYRNRVEGVEVQTVLLRARFVVGHGGRLTLSPDQARPWSGGERVFRNTPVEPVKERLPPTLLLRDALDRRRLFLGRGTGVSDAALGTASEVFVFDVPRARVLATVRGVDATEEHALELFEVRLDAGHRVAHLVWFAELPLLGADEPTITLELEGAPLTRPLPHPLPMAQAS